MEAGVRLSLHGLRLQVPMRRVKGKDVGLTPKWPGSQGVALDSRDQRQLEWPIFCLLLSSFIQLPSLLPPALSRPRAASR